MTRHSYPLACILGTLALAACNPAPPPADRPPEGPRRVSVEYIPVPGRTDLPFSKAVRVGDMLYLSGELGTDSTGKLVAGGIQA